MGEEPALIMVLYIKKYSGLVYLLLVLAVLWSVFFIQATTLLFASATILLFLTIDTFFILEKHKDAEDKRQKITRDILILIVTLILIVLLGWLAGTLVGGQARAQFGMRVGLLCALIVSFGVGYLVKKGLGKVLR